MSGDVVNLRLARKQRARAEADSVAAQNRARFGQSRAERETRGREEARAERRLDGHYVGTDAGDGGRD